MTGYNLLDSPWLNVAQGLNTCRVGLLTLLEQIALSDDILGRTPMEQVGAWRLVIAVANAINPDGVWQSNRIAPFVEQWGNRFDLVSTTAPFMQSPPLDGKRSLLARLFPELPSGDYPIHWKHTERKVFCASCIAYGLAALSAFATQGGGDGQGGGFAPSINGKPPIYALPVGESVLEVIEKSLRPVPNTDGTPWKRQPGAYFTGSPVGYLHGLTWLPRKIWIDWRNGQARCDRCADHCALWAESMIFIPGDKYEGEGWQDPFVGYKKGAKGETLPVRPFGRHNDWTTFVTEAWSENRPEIVAGQDRVRAFGFVTDQAKFEDSFALTISLTK